MKIKIDEEEYEVIFDEWDEWMECPYCKTYDEMYFHMETEEATCTNCKKDFAVKWKLFAQPVADDIDLENSEIGLTELRCPFCFDKDEYKVNNIEENYICKKCNKNFVFYSLLGEK